MRADVGSKASVIPRVGGGWVERGWTESGEWGEK